MNMEIISTDGDSASYDISINGMELSMLNTLNLSSHDQVTEYINMPEEMKKLTAKVEKLWILHDEQAIKIKRQAIEIEEQSTTIKKQAIEIEEQAMMVKRQAIEIEDLSMTIKKQAIENEEQATMIKRQAIEIEDLSMIINSQVDTMKQKEAVVERLERIPSGIMYIEKFNETTPINRRLFRIVSSGSNSNLLIYGTCSVDHSKIT